VKERERKMQEELEMTKNKMLKMQQIDPYMIIN